MMMSEQEIKELQQTIFQRNREINELSDEITRLRALVEAKNEAIEKLMGEVPYSDNWDAVRQQARAVLEKE